MTRAQLNVWACGLTALGLAVGGAVAVSQNARAQSPPTEPGAKQGALRPKESKPAPSGGGLAAEVEALKKEVEALRKKVEALEHGEKRPNQEFRKIVVTSPTTKDVIITQQYVCKVLAQRHIKVSALTGGMITEIPVKDGQAVKKGEVVFKVSPTVYQAKLDAARADVRAAELELNNTKKLFESKTVSAQEVQLYQAKLAKAQAKANLAEAELSFTTVRAPFDGLLDRFQAQQGSLVKEGDTVTTLSDNSVMWVYFNVPETHYLEYVANRKQDPEGPPVGLVLANGRKWPQTSKVAAVEANFNSGSEDIPFRADFPNPDGLLRHGQTGTVVIRRAVNNAVVIPQRATFEVLNKRYVFVVGKDDVARQREVDVQHELGGAFVVKKGIDANDRIVVDGVRQVRDGDKVEYELRKPEDVATDPNDPAKK